jgi:uncharacterized protein YecE (DUF72 family)
MSEESRTETQWRVGGSGFYYPEWKGLFYPDDLPKSKWFDYYCQVFNSLEINGSFYRYPRLNMLTGWYQKSPADFDFSVKVPRFITHFWKFRNVREKLADFYSVVKEGLREKLGCILFQLHPETRYSEEMLDQILASLDPSANNVIEFRDRSWWTKEVVERLKRENVTFCSISYPNLPDDIVKTTDIAYYRFHGVPVLYRSKYGKTKLAEVYSNVRRFSKAYVYFNNTADGSAVKDAKTFLKLVNVTPSLRHQQDCSTPHV